MPRTNVLATVCTLLAALATGWLIVDTQAGIGEARADLHALSDRLDALEARAREQPTLEAQLQATDATSSEFTKLLPAPEVATHEDMLRSLQQAGASSGLRVDGVRVR